MLRLGSVKQSLIVRSTMAARWQTFLANPGHGNDDDDVDDDQRVAVLVDWECLLCSAQYMHTMSTERSAGMLAPAGVMWLANAEEEQTRSAECRRKQRPDRRRDPASRKGGRV